jgi:hypothetical protein
MKEIRKILDEISFTNLCKLGYISVTTEMGKSNLYFNKNDIKTLIYGGDILEKEIDDAKFLFIMDNLDIEYIKEILKRSPIYSEIVEEI